MRRSRHEAWYSLYAIRHPGQGEHHKLGVHVISQLQNLYPFYQEEQARLAIRPETDRSLLAEFCQVSREHVCRWAGGKPLLSLVQSVNAAIFQDHDWRLVKNVFRRNGLVIQITPTQEDTRSLQEALLSLTAHAARFFHLLTAAQQNEELTEEHIDEMEHEWEQTDRDHRLLIQQLREQVRKKQEKDNGEGIGNGNQAG